MQSNEVVATSLQKNVLNSGKRLIENGETLIKDYVMTLNLDVINTSLEARAKLIHQLHGFHACK
jgi:hypothetical protein